MSSFRASIRPNASSESQARKERRSLTPFWDKTSKDNMMEDEMSTSVVGHMNQPAATFSYENRRQNLKPNKNSDLFAASSMDKSEESLKGWKPWRKAYMKYHNENKDKKRNPRALSQISAEALIQSNPLLEAKEDSVMSNYQVRDLYSLTLSDLCILNVAFQAADVDNSGALDMQEFVNAFFPLLAAGAGDLDLMFMRIDADCDGTITWEEFLSFIVMQDDGAIQLETESSRKLFQYPSIADNALQIVGHKEVATGLICFDEVDKYLSYSRKGDLLVWWPDAIDGVKIRSPKLYQSDLSFIVGLIHVAKFGHSDRFALCAANKRILFLDLIRDSFKVVGQLVLDISPLSMCMIAIKGDRESSNESMIAFGDDFGNIHLYDADKLIKIASRHEITTNGLSKEKWTAKSAYISSWLAHEKTAWVTKLEYHDETRMLLSAASDGQLVVSDVIRQTIKHDGFRHRGEVADFLWMPKWQLLASCGIERYISIWQIPIKTPAYKLEGHQASIHKLAYGGGQLISLDTSKTIIVWDLKDMEPIQRLEAAKVHQEFPVSSIIFDVRRNTLLSISRKILPWHISERKVPNGHALPISCCVYNPTFEILVSTDEASVVRVWNVNTGKAIIRYENAHTNEKAEPVKITAATFDQTNRRLITGAHDGSIKVWNFSTGQRLRELEGFGSGEVTSIQNFSITPYDYIVATGWNHKVSFWEESGNNTERQNSKTVSHHFEGHGEDILCMVCHKEANLIVTSSYDGDIIIWNQELGIPRAHLVLPGIRMMTQEQKPIEAMVVIICPSKTLQENIVLLVTAGGDSVVRFWNVSGVPELLLEHVMRDSREAGLSSLVACERSKVMIITDNHGFVYVFDIKTTMASAGQAANLSDIRLSPPVQRSRFRAHHQSITSVCYVNSRRIVITGSRDCTICVWTIQGRKLGILGEPSGWELTADMFRDFKLDEPAFEDTLPDEEESGRQSDSPSSAAELSKESVHPGSDLSSSIAVFTSQPQAAGRRSAGAEQPRGDGKKTITDESRQQATQNAFFMTQDLDISAITKDSEEDEEDRDTGSVSDSSSTDLEHVSRSDAGPLLLRDVRGKQEISINYALKDEVDSILQRAKEKRENPEKYFEAASLEISAYQKMIVSQLSELSLPASVSKKMMKGKKPVKAALPQGKDHTLMSDADSEVGSESAFDRDRAL
uniref:EF-hand domain-containing protein n=1 Tax=Hanusia phi TaxID=3032 RepID=A0A7S0EZG7_9CRYP|mmetsp:Transcript_34392/g.77524  ORF Transcript_34392/g.77524 Transcript_34392/m.77524 type:complete len:1186 (+) Transcript_34392:297-3854(+)